MTRNVSVARLERACPEADLAALMTWEALAEAKRIRADLHRRHLRELPPEPGEVGPFVDDIPNPFRAPGEAPDRYLQQHEGAVPLHIPPLASWEQHRDYAATRAFRAASEAGIRALPELKVFGNGDSLDDRQRADMISESLRCRHPFAVINPIDNLTTFLAVEGDERYASAAIVFANLRHVAVAVAAGPTLALGTHHIALIHRNDRTWTPAAELPNIPVLHASIAAPIGTHGRCSQPETTTLFPGGNPVVLSGLILGGIEAAYQPDSWPCDCAAMYIAAAAGYTIVQADTGKTLNHPGQVQRLLTNALINNVTVPGLIAARDELAARRALTYVRKCGTA